MKGKANEWISIADLMAGVMAVIMLLLVISILQRTSEAGDEQSRQQKVRQLLADLQDVVHKGGEDDLVSVDPEQEAIRLKVHFFGDGSACVTRGDRKRGDPKYAIQLIQKSVKDFLANDPNSDVLVEGHTNGTPVKDIRRRPEGQWDFDQKYCSLYDDNLTLSAARAREVRKEIVTDANLNDRDAGRIIVAGYGDSRPLAGTNPNDAINKRVEISLRIHWKSEK